MNRKYLCLGLAAMVLLALFGMALQDPLRFPAVTRAVAAFTTPFTAGTQAVGGWVDGIDNKITSAETLQRENEELKRENDELRYANIAMAEIYAENQRLREFLNYKNEHPHFNLLVAKVLGLTPGDLRDTMFIDKGAEDGVRQDMAVVTTDGLIGLVDEVHPSSARIVLATSARCNVGGRILRANSRAVGVVTGRGAENVPLLMEHLPREAEVLPGDVVVTSGYSENHPEGIVIGTVQESSFDAAGLLRTATVVPAANKTGLEEVMVVVWHQDGGAR